MRCKKCVLAGESACVHIQKFTSRSPLDAHIWCGSYDNYGEILKDAKYRGNFSHYRHLAPALAQSINNSVSQPFFITYVPTTKTHRKQRGFDHSRYLASRVARLLNCEWGSCVSPKREFVQANSTRDQRTHNPAYAIEKIPSHSTVIVIDDIATTRSSLMACASTLRKCGITYVIGATIAYTY